MIVYNFELMFHHGLCISVCHIKDKNRNLLVESLTFKQTIKTSEFRYYSLT